MKTTTTQKLIVTYLFILVVGMGSFVYYIMSEIKDRGGIRAIVVETGKEIKEIKREIDAP